MDREETMPRNTIAEEYWGHAIDRIRQLNPNLLGKKASINGNALNGLRRGVVQFVWLANQKSRVLPDKTIAVGFYLDIKKKDKTDDDRKRIRETYETLSTRRKEIEAMFPGTSWSWHNPDDHFAANVYCYRRLDFTDEANREECITFHAEMMKRLYEKVYLAFVEGVRPHVSGYNENGVKNPMLSSILKEFKLDPETTKLVRHSYHDAKACIEKGLIESYQSIQKNNVFHGKTHVLSFMGEPKGTTAVFLGLYEVRGEYIGNHRSRMPEGYPQPEDFQNHRFFYDLAKLDDMALLEGKLKIEWGNSAKQWSQNGTTDKMILECPEYNTSPIKHKVVFCNVAYMKYYDSDIAEPAPKTGGSFVRDNGFGFERNNFHVYQEPTSDFCKGFVETGHSGELSSAATSHQLNISRIDPKEEEGEKVEGVTVIFCATRPDFGCVIVGWYRNATAFKCVQEDSFGNLYSFVADSSGCVLLDEKKRVFKVPRSGRDGSDFGFGRFNVWYADDDSSHEYVSRVMRYIVQSSEEPVDDPEEESLSTEETPEFIESGVGKKTIVNSYERNQKARRECLRIHGTDCIVCGFNSAKVYGPDFEKKIEVHHVIPISERGGDYKVNPGKDLIPVCPNCHSILHSKNKDGRTLTWKELRARIKGETD